MKSGLEDVIAAETVLSDVDGQAGRLIVRGISLDELAGRRFEDVAGLLFDGFFAELPDAAPVGAALGAARVRVFPHVGALDDGLLALTPTEAVRALLARLNAVNRDLGLPEMPEYDPARRGAADSSFVAADADTLAGMGAAGGASHAEGEWIALSSLPRQATRAAILMTRLSREAR